MDPAISFMVVLLPEGITSLWDNSRVWIKRGDWSTRMAYIKWKISKRETKCRCSFFWWKKRGSWFSNNRRKTERSPSKFLAFNILRQMLMMERLMISNMNLNSMSMYLPVNSLRRWWKDCRMWTNNHNSTRIFPLKASSVEDRATRVSFQQSKAIITTIWWIKTLQPIQLWQLNKCCSKKWEVSFRTKDQIAANGSGTRGRLPMSPLIINPCWEPFLRVVQANYQQISIPRPSLINTESSRSLTPI